MIRSCVLLLMLLSAFSLHAQEKIILINGNIIKAKSVDLSNNKISYLGLKEGSKLKTIVPYKVFSIQHADSSEKVIYAKDSLDPNDFSIEEMRNFIRGEQDAKKYYHNNFNKGAAAFIGAGFSYFTIYGLIGPPLYTSIVGGFSPNMDKQKVSDEALRKVPEYCEGYSRKVRDRKIRNSIISGLAGFAVGFATFAIVERNN